MYKLYYAPGACSLAVHVVLHEIGGEHTLEKVDFQKRDEFLKINSRGAVPVLEEDGKILREGAAILQYLVDSNNSGLLPRQGFERAKALEWLSFANSTLHPAYSPVFGLGYLDLDDATKAKLKNVYRQKIQKLWDDVEQHLTKNGPYLTGSAVSVADILVTVIANWTPGLFGSEVKFGSKTENLLRSVSARPAYQKSLKAEGVEYKAVA